MHNGRVNPHFHFDPGQDGPLVDWLAAATAMALDAIHGRGIVHLDLKPANILMPRKGGLKISDFGLAATLTDHEPHDIPSVGAERHSDPDLASGESEEHRDHYQHRRSNEFKEATSGGVVCH